MTKQELLRKRGIKINEETLSPSESLLTAKPNKADKATAKKASTSKKTQVAEKKSKEDLPPKNAVNEEKVILPQPEVDESVTSKEVLSEKKEKNKGGRPRKRTEPYKILNIGVPISVYEDVYQYALPLYDNNMTVYINTLIKKDLESNIDSYKQVRAMMKKAKGI